MAETRFIFCILQKQICHFLLEGLWFSCWH